MTAEEWKKIIIKACKGVETYRKEYNSIIDTLSQILEQRDIAYAQYTAISGTPLLIETLEDESKSIKKNPALQIWTDLNKESLNYWRELGLTPAGLKKITDTITTSKKDSNVSDILKKMQA